MLKSAFLRYAPESVIRPTRTIYHAWKAPHLKEPEFEWILPYLSGPVIDVGANIGKFTCFCAQHSPRVVAIEPADENFRVLTISKRIHRLRNVELIHAAASDKVGILKFSVPKFSDGSENLYEGHVSDEGVSIPAITLDSLGISPTFIKIDVEGHELEVLQGAIKTLQNLPALLVEVLHTSTEQFLADLGYKRIRSLGVNGMFVSKNQSAYSSYSPVLSELV